MKNITYNLEVATPNFLYFINNMNNTLSRWLQYKGVEMEGGKLFFKFKSSDSSLSFRVYAGENINTLLFTLRGRSNEIYDYFEELKNKHLK